MMSETLRGRTALACGLILAVLGGWGRGCGTESGEVSPCFGVLCNEPPANACLDGATLRAYSAAGRCESNACLYDYEDVACDGECLEGACADQTFHLSDGSDALPPDDRSTTDVQMVDFDGDGDLDIVWANQPDEADNPGGLELSINEGSGFFSAMTFPGQEEIGSWTFVLPVDIEGDGDLDLVLSRPAYTSAEVLLVANEGSGRFVIDEAAAPFLSGETHGIVFGRVAAGDVDVDGDLDLVVPVAYDVDLVEDRPNVLLMNRGDGTFELDEAGRIPPLDAGTDYTLSAAVGDVTGEGAPDIFLGESENPQRILINDGSGFFTDESGYSESGGPRLPADRIRGYDSKMVDIEHDGDVDIIVVNDVSLTSGEPVVMGNTLFLNDGTGRFSILPLPLTDEAHDSRGLAIGDVNLDGHPDIIIGNSGDTVPHGGTALEILMGQGNSVFRPVEDLPSFEKGIFAVAMGDLDGDAFPDVACAVAMPDAAGSKTNLLLLSSR